MVYLDGVSYGKKNFLEQFASGAVSLAGAAIGGQLTTSAGAASGAIAGGAVAAGNFALTQAGNAVKNMSIIMIILGTLQFIMRPIFGDSHPLIFVLSLVLFVMAGYAMAEKVQVDRVVVFAPMAIFAVWYFYFRANIESGFLVYFLSIAISMLFLIDVITKGRAVQPELYGLLPVVFFFLDIGLIPFLIDTIGLPMTNIAQNLILFMPWWAFFGVMTFPIDPEDKESKINALMRIIHIIGVIYIVFVFLLPMVPTLGYDSNSLVPDASTFTSTQEEYREQLSGTDNPIISMVICLWQGEFGTLDECVEERAEQKEIANNCHNEGYDEGSSAFDECVEKENQEREEWEDSISGAVSSNLDLHVEIELTKGDFFDDDVELNSEDWGNVDYPVEVRIENPKNKEFLALVNCNFENKDDDEPSVEGIIFHNDFDEEGFLKVYESEEYDFYCEPVSPLNGTYNMNFSVMFSMETNSYLKRAYVEEYDQKKETTGSTLKDDLISEFFMGDGQNGQAYYADEFVAFVFEIGDKVTEVEKHPRLTSTIKNVGDGSIKSILWYEVYIEEMELDDDSDACLYDFIEVDEDSAIYIEEGNDKDDSFLIGSCQLKAGSKIEETVEDPTRGVYVEIFGASVSYVYELSSKFKVEVDLK